MASWEAERRLDFIEDRLIDEGRVNRADVIDYFGISSPQASLDFARYREQNKRFIYDRNAKAYFITGDGKAATPVRGSTPARRKAWALFKGKA